MDIKGMVRGLLCAGAVLAASVARAEGDEPAEYVKDVPAGTSAELTADEVAAAAGMTFVKTGGGTLVVKDEIADFAGDIRIREGYYEVWTSGALGTADGATYVEAGGTLVNRRSTAATAGTDPAFRDEVIHLNGMGADNSGALRDLVLCVDFSKTVVLDGDTLITGNGRLDFRGTAFDMNGHKLTVDMPGGGLFLVVLTFTNMGDIEVKGGVLEFQTHVNGCLPTATVTIRRNGWLSFWDLASWLTCRFVLEDGVKLQAENGQFKYDGTDNRNVHCDTDFELQAMTVNDLAKNMQWQLRGRLTGAGGIQGGKGGYLQLINDKGDNDFAGGLDIAGVVEDGNPVGGVVAYHDGNIPAGADAAPLKLTNASLQLRDQAAFHLPDVVADGRVVISNMDTVATCAAKSLKKTGTDELTVFGPLGVAGATEIEAGTLRFATQVPHQVSGLKWTYRNKTAGIDTDQKQGVDRTGVAYAYKTWPAGVDMAMTYTGYIRVPGEEGTDVTCNWVTSIARGCKVTIGGVVCCEFNDNKNVKDDITVGWDRFAIYEPVTLKAGWQPITVQMSNWYNNQRGPQDTRAQGWDVNFAIGVDWEGRHEVAPANYAKLLDPGDGSFLRAVQLEEDGRVVGGWAKDPGLKWTYRNNQAGVNPAQDKGIDNTGVAYAYKGWPEGVDMAITYTGYIRVPGEEGADVTCNWVTSIARGCKVTIGGVVCCEFNDNKNVKDNVTVGWDRFAIYEPVTLKAGWQPITVAMSNWYNNQRGPQDTRTQGWDVNFAIGVDWQGRHEVAPANYAKLLDPGDGSFLRATLEEETRDTLLNETFFRPTFAGAVAFGPGAVLDIGDTAPYTPVKMPSLTGRPTVRNGAVAVQSATWTLRKDDLLDADNKPHGAPLTLGDGATLTFPAGPVTIDMPADDAAALANVRRSADCPLLADAAAFAGNTFALSEALRATGWYLVTEDGALILRQSASTVLLFR